MIDEEIITSINDEHSQNAYSQIEVTDEKIFTCVNNEHSLNIDFGIVLRFPKISNDFTPSNDFLPISTTDDILVNEQQPQNESSSINLTEDGIDI